MSLSAGKIAEVIFENAIETYEEQKLMLDLVDGETQGDAKLQNAGDTIWYPVQQHRPVLKGFDLTGQEQGIIEETFPISLDTPSNDLIEQRLDNMRDMRFWERAGKQSGMQQATDLNSEIANLINNTGSLFYRSNVTSGFDFISEAQSLIGERQVFKTMGANFLLNTRDNNKFAKDLAGRETLKGRPADTWLNGQIGSNVAEFDLFQGSFNPNIAGGADPATTLTATVSEKPEGGSVNATTKVVTNIDYRLGTLPVVASASYNVGDIVTVGAVESIGLASKDKSGQLMTFKVVGIPDGTTLEVFPKPIALDDAGLTVLEKAYANVDTQLTSGDAVNRVNIDASAKTNLFWCKDSIKMIGGDAPWELMQEFGGMKTLSKALTSGVTLYMVWDGDITTATFKYRIFVWYGLANCNPMANGQAVTF
jgi:hypothetical protein